MRLWLLGSGSGGNAVLLESDGSRVLIDAGFPARTLALRLGAIGIAPASVEACVITHAHTDHMKGAAVARRKWGWALFATRGTVACCPELHDAGVTTFAAGDTLRLGRMSVATHRTPHDCADPIGAVVTAERSGVRAGICYDVGHVSDGVRTICRDVDLLVLEANHDEGMLRAGPYPFVVQQRIAGRTGHLSNREAAGVARDSVSRTLNHVILAHLSERCNDHGVARMTVNAGLTQGGYRGSLTTAAQHAPVGPFTAKASRAPVPEQYALF